MGHTTSKNSDFCIYGSYFDHLNFFMQWLANFPIELSISEQKTILLNQLVLIKYLYCHTL